MLYTIGNIDQHILRFNHLSKRGKRSPERKMLSILRNFQMQMEFMILSHGESQILVAMIKFVVLLPVENLSLLVK